MDRDLLTLSATDLSNFLNCRHLTGLDLSVARGTRRHPHFDDPLVELLFKRGLDHEKAYVASLAAEGRTIADLREHRTSRADTIARTVEAMRAGADTIVQGALGDDHWFGYPDVLLRRDDLPSALGPWSYEVVDTKLARATRAGMVLQLCLYTELLGAAQGRVPERFFIVTPDATHPFRFENYAAYFRLIQRQLLATVARDAEAVLAEHYPEPVEHCEVCAWSGVCDKKRHDDDHLSLVAGASRIQRRELEGRGIGTLTAAAGLPDPLGFKPKRGSKESYSRLRDQARVQLASRGRTPPVHELIPSEPGFGLGRLPEPSPGDVFLDLEGDPFACEGGREYLFGLVTVEDDGRPKYHEFWAFTEAQERVAFEAAIDLIMTRLARWPDLHVYHYAPYEPAAFKRLMGRHATRGDELDRLLRAERFVDLLAVVRQGVRVGVESYSIKKLEPCYGFERAVPLKDANLCLQQMEVALELGEGSTVPDQVRKGVAGYNKDDCVSTLRLRDWLETLRAETQAGGTEIPRPTPKEGDPSEQVSDRAQKVEDLRGRLLAGIPEEREQRNDEQEARWILAYLLDWHRREDRAAWWEYFRLRELPEEKLLDERDAVAGLEFVETVHVNRYKDGKPTGTVVDRYRYPPQEIEIGRGDELKLQDGKKFGDVEGVDRTARTIDVKTGQAYTDVHPTAAFAHSYINPKAMVNALYEMGLALAEEGGGGVATGADRPDRPGRDLLLRHPPSLATGSFDGTRSDVGAAVATALGLDDSVLAIQGPPGSGKTYTGARMILAAVAKGKRVGVTATSHKVIDNLLRAVAEAAKKTGVTVFLGHKVTRLPEDGVPGVAYFTDNAKPRAAVADRTIQVMGGTAHLWAREDFAGSVDLLFVDEAGQMSLANTLAASRAGRSLVLLGDPQQLDQPIKGTHPEGAGTSALQHVLGGHQTMPPELGLFLPVTRRLAPAICDYTSEIFYERKLKPFQGLERQVLTGTGRFDGAGLWAEDVAHDGNRNYSEEEIEAVDRLVAELTREGARWTDADGVEHPLTGSDILVVAPYNAQVTRLAERLEGQGVRVGTVDKFQGQEAPVVIYSMATSRPEDAPRGMEFLYSPNRLNVATSRARCAAILVASPLVYEPECRSPRQMQLANALCRFREMVVGSPSPSL